MQETSTHVLEESVPKLTKTLNVLTILTFIGCGLSYIACIYGWLTSANYDTQHEKLMEASDKVGDSGFARTMIDKSLEMIESNKDYINKAYEYRHILGIATLVFITFCLVGAIRMRKLRKSGFPIYTIGELGPLAMTLILLGANFSQTWAMILTYIVPIIFVILYATQRKHLVRP
jgi:hypothetical protein